MNWDKKKKLCFAALAIALLAILLIEIFFARWLRATDIGNIYYETTVRAIGFVAFAVLIVFMDFGNIFKFRGIKSLKDRIFIAISFVIAINNFPFISVLSGDAYVSGNSIDIALFAIQCFVVGGFEELAFRGFAFILILQKLEKSTKGAFVSIALSSVLFGLIHIINVFAGAGIGNVLLQIGYSALIGGLASVVLLKTHNIWYCVVLHALYNFNGGLVSNFGGGTIWTMPEMIFTAAVSVAVAIYVVYEFIKIPEREIESLFIKKRGELRNDNL